MELEPSAAYQAALERSRESSRAFTKVQNDYRSLKIGDTEYLAARAVYDKSVAEFDAAFAAEQARVEELSRKIDKLEGK